MLLEIFILLALFLIFLQDMNSRSVYWFMFPFLAIMLAWLHFKQSQSFIELWQACLFNIVFLVFQLALLMIYFSIKNKRWVNINNQYLGLGDILFLLSIAFYMSVLNFLFFYLVSLIGILLFWSVWQAVSIKKDKQIPLAGLQALIFSVFLAGDWYLFHVNLTDNTWLLNLIHK